MSGVYGELEVRKVGTGLGICPMFEMSYETGMGPFGLSLDSQCLGSVRNMFFSGPRVNLGECGWFEGYFFFFFKD